MLIKEQEQQALLKKQADERKEQEHQALLKKQADERAALEAKLKAEEEERLK